MGLKVSRIDILHALSQNPIDTLKTERFSGYYLFQVNTSQERNHHLHHRSRKQIATTFRPEPTHAILARFLTSSFHPNPNDYTPSSTPPTTSSSLPQNTSLLLRRMHLLRQSLLQALRHSLLYNLRHHTIPRGMAHASIGGGVCAGPGVVDGVGDFLLDFLGQDFL